MRFDRSSLALGSSNTPLLRPNTPGGDPRMIYGGPKAALCGSARAYFHDRREQSHGDFVPEGSFRPLGEQVLHRLGGHVLAEAEVELLRHYVLRKGHSMALDPARVVYVVHLVPLLRQHDGLAVVDEVSDVVLREAAEMGGHL